MQAGRVYYAGSQWNFTSSADGAYEAGQKSEKTGYLKTTGKQKGRITVKKRIAASGYMVRIARARTPSQVSSVIRTARADMQFVKNCSTESGDLKKAMCILKQVVAKSQLKIRRLRVEENLEKKEKLAF